MKILVVDDETDVKLLFEQRFRKEIRDQVYQFSFAFSGEEALQVLEEEGSEILLILSDINMPGMSGLDLLKEVRSVYPAAPPKVYMVTAYGDEENRQGAHDLGADDFLTKPIDFSILKGKLHV